MPPEIRNLLGSLTVEDLEFLAAYKRLPYYLFNHARTWDEHDKIQPVKRFPAKEHIRWLAEEWIENLLLAVPKSRQMQVTWTIVACYLWDTWTSRGRLNLFQSKKEDDADQLVWRGWHIWTHLPEHLHRGILEEDGQRITVPLRCNLSTNGQHKFCAFELVDDTGHLWSKIVGVPQGADQVRQYTASGIFSDETAYQEDPEGSWIAAKPTIEGGGRYTVVSTAAPGWFKRVVFDELEAA